MSPSEPNIDSVLNLSYNYYDEMSAPESGSTITWWRQRTGIEYVTFNTATGLAVSGSLIGLNTFDVGSLYNQSEIPFILTITTNSAGVTTNVVDVVIKDRGASFIGTGTNLEGITTVRLETSPVTFATISNLGAAVTAHVLPATYTPGYATTSSYVRINPDSPIGYVNTIHGISGAVTFTSFADYDGRTFERSADVSSRTIFDGRDNIYATVQPSNSSEKGIVYESNTVTMTKYYTPSVSNLTILGSFSSSNGITTSLSIFANTDQVPSFTYTCGESVYTQNNSFSWYKLIKNGIKLISSSSTLSSSLIDVSDQIYYTIYPGVIRSDSTLGFGVTVNSDIYTVV
jgi:hypothetical protein